MWQLRGSGRVFTRGLTVVPCRFRPAARPARCADSLTLSARSPLWMSPIQNKPPSSPHSHRHAHTAHLPPPQWSRCSAELVRGLVRFSKENNDLAFSPLREGYLISPTLKESGFWANSIFFLQKTKKVPFNRANKRGYIFGCFKMFNCVLNMLNLMSNSVCWD